MGHKLLKLCASMFLTSLDFLLYEGKDGEKEYELSLMLFVWYICLTLIKFTFFYKIFVFFCFLKKSTKIIKLCHRRCGHSCLCLCGKGVFSFFVFFLFLSGKCINIKCVKLWLTQQMREKYLIWNSNM